MMDQENTNQVPVSQEKVKDLIEMVRKLLNENKRNPEPEDPYVTTRMPLTDLSVYPELIEALPSIEEDFLRTPLTEEERKEAIHSCPRSGSMNYHPPPLNESASYAVMKANAYLHVIQIALAQATRLIEYYVHFIIQDNQQANSEDPHILFSNTMRVHLADIAVSLTQGRSKDSEENRKRLEEFDEESAATPEETSDGATTTDTSSKTAQEENGSSHARSPDNRSGVTIDQDSDRGSKDTGSWILQQYFRNTKEYRGNHTSLGSEETESPCTGAKLQDGAPLLNLSTDPQEGLHDVTGSRRYI
ncbi:hypothetical protein AYI70_g7323 [Smittium culicis]|uniref:Uncharacterized protein n=1 Tax=Smittium culicis TaxID=133412 RepID=A0A1R1XL74_9FUNG|nr:hypothetical protein AYI70_g7323 [Smittium culicis]